MFTFLYCNKYLVKLRCKKQELRKKIRLDCLEEKNGTQINNSQEEKNIYRLDSIEMLYSYLLIDLQL